MIGVVVYFFIFKPGWIVWLLFFAVVVVIAVALEVLLDGKPITLKNALLSFVGTSLKLLLELLFLCTLIPYLAICLFGRFLFFAAAVSSLMVILTMVHHGLGHFGIKWLSPPPELVSLQGFLLQLAAAALSIGMTLLYLKIMGIDEERPMDLFFGFWGKLYQRSQRYFGGGK